MRKLIARFPKFTSKFTSMINIPVFTNDELVNFAKIYTRENGYTIDQMAMLSLYNLISTSQKEDQPMCIGTVKTMLDNAMAKHRADYSNAPRSVWTVMDSPYFLKRISAEINRKAEVKNMARPYLGNPKYTIEVLQKYHFVFQKRFGQNFLIDEHVLEKIIDSSGITKDDFILEIGPGIGTMTQYLAEAAREVAAVEIDSSLIPILKDTLKEWDNVTVINNDILKTDIKKIANEKNGGKPVKVVANLPYYITTPIIMGLFEKNVPVDSITVMVQKEVADRMQVGPGTKDYGALSLAVQYYAKPEIVAKRAAELFHATAEGRKCGDQTDTL